MFLFSPFSLFFQKCTMKVEKTFDPLRKADKVLFVERTKDPNEGLLFSDFNTQSLIDAGAIDLLQPFSPLSASRLSALDSSSAAVSSLSSLVDNLSESSVNSENTETENTETK